MSLAPVIQMLRQRAGLNPDAVGGTTIPIAVAARMRALGLSDPAAYAARLTADAEEFPSLVDEVIVPETWFFRGGPLFAYLAEHARTVLRGRPAGRPFRALSIPCCTGEEPYSLAVALHEAGVPAADRTILGVDLSRRCLDRARRGEYGDFSFRQTDPELRRRYFRPADGRWQIDARLREAVAFREGNLLDPLFLAGEAPFDLVLCRNLFIYLLPDARRQAVAALELLLAADGLLCVGPAEPLELLAPQFRHVGPDECFLYRRGGEPPRDLALLGVRRHAPPLPRRPRTRWPRRGASPTAAGSRRPSPPAGPTSTEPARRRRCTPCSARSTRVAARPTRRSAASAAPCTSTRTTSSPWPI